MTAGTEGLLGGEAKVNEGSNVPQKVSQKAAKREMGYSGTEMAPLSGVTTSSVNRLAVSDIPPKVMNYLNAL